MSPAALPLERPGTLPATGDFRSPRPNEIDVWQIPLDQPAERLAVLRTWLSPDEEERAVGFHFERDRRRFMVGRAALRDLLGRYTGCAPRAVTFRYGEHGKPELAWPAAGDLHFNLAHSEGVALCAFSRNGPVGVDIERVRDVPEWRDIAETCFCPEERTRIAAVASGDRRRAFFHAWTRQEAIVKATGAGLAAVPPAAGAAQSLRVYPLPIDAQFAAAVAVGPGARGVTWRQWPPADAGGKGTPPGGRRLGLGEAHNFNFQEP